MPLSLVLWCLSHELLHYINQKKIGANTFAVVKIDMSKVYDRVHWICITKVLRAFGFPPFWINIIFQSVSTVSYTLLINGCLSDNFKLSCGLREGDPLSTYNFPFCMQIYFIMPNLGQDLGSFKGVSINRHSPNFHTFCLWMMLYFSFKQKLNLVLP